MDKWEYKFAQVRFFDSSGNPMSWKLFITHEDRGEVSTVMRNFADWLNEQGDEGWELVGVVPVPHAGSGLLILKRRKP
jgi:Domain of unknown function (DUF4177)